MSYPISILKNKIDIWIDCRDGYRKLSRRKEKKHWFTKEEWRIRAKDITTDIKILRNAIKKLSK